MSDTDQTEDEQVGRDFAAAVFGRTEDDPDEPDEQQKPPGNYVPKEGNIPKPPRNDQDMREFTRALFDTD